MDTWLITETDFDADLRGHCEAIFAIGNGYLGTRGTFEEGYRDDEPVTLVNGVFDDAPIVHTELVNVPDWTGLRVRVGSSWFGMDEGEVETYERTLDMRRGLLTRSVRWRSPEGSLLDLVFERFASMADPHVVVARCRVTSLSHSGAVAVRAGLSATVGNGDIRHWRLSRQEAANDRAVALAVTTRSTGVTLAAAAAVTASSTGTVSYEAGDCLWAPYVTVQTRLRPGGAIEVDKVVVITTTRDVEDPYARAVHEAQAASRRGAPMLRREHEAAWEALWAASDVVIEGDAAAEQAVRFGLYHLLIAAPRHEDRVSIPARTLSGYGYRGHALWESEIYMLPFYVYTQPEVARNLLMYRYHTLAGARRKAARQGYEGAMFAWESAATGDETTARWMPVRSEELGEEGVVRVWTGDIAHHNTAGVVYGVVQYWQATGDEAFMRAYGAEIVLSAAVFWGSRPVWDEARQGFIVEDVIGPDESHEHVDNNAFTNAMARWTLQVGREVLGWLKARHPRDADRLVADLALTEDRLAHWSSVIEGLVVTADPETGIIEQFDGFDRLKQVDLATYEPRSASMQALLGVEETQNYQVLKQPDVLMLLHLLPDAFDAETMAANWSYYAARTDLTFGSALGPPIHAALAARLGYREAAREAFDLAIHTDLGNARGDSEAGIHAAAAGGIWQAVVFGFGGVALTDDGPVASPRLPPGWTRLRFSLQYRGERIDFDLRA